MLQKKSKYVVAIAGAAGLAGREMLEILEERTFPAEDLVLLDSAESAGERLEFGGRSRTVKLLAAESFQGVDIAFFAAESEASRQFSPAAIQAGAVVIDCSDAFRRDPNVPLVVPEVNPGAIAGQSKILSVPDSTAAALAVALGPIHAAAGIRRLVLTAFLSVSGSGKKATDELAGQTVALLNFRDVETSVFPHQIAFNCIPHVGAFLDNGWTGRESGLQDEMRKILKDEQVRVTATAVQVPVFRGDALSVNIETGKKIGANEVRALLSAAPGIVLYDDPAKNIYPTPIDTAGKDQVYAGRIREDESIVNGISLWMVSDSVRGSLVKAIQIAERLIA